MSASSDTFALVLAQPVITPAGEHPRLVHLSWRPSAGADLSQRLVQVYLDGMLVAVTQSESQREAWISCDRRRPHCLELLAVPTDDPDSAEGFWRTWPASLTGCDSSSGRFVVRLLRDERLPVKTQILVRLDGQEIDRLPLWADDEHRAGFGALFGLGQFGRDAATALGLGRGELGVGPLGLDGVAWRWQGDDWPAGTHVLELAAVDLAGQAVADPVTLTGLEIPPPPADAGPLTIQSDFTLLWAD